MISDLSVLLFLRTPFVGDAGHFFWIAAARWLVFVLAGLLMVALTWKRSQFTRHEFFDALWSVVVALLLAVILGHLVGRVRPFVGFPEVVVPWVPSPLSDDSFPSRHAAIAFAMAFFLHRHAKGPVVWIGWILAILIALGRVLVGVHYPTDVMAGAFVGCLSVFLVEWGHRQMRRRDLSSSVRRHTPHD